MLPTGDKAQKALHPDPIPSAAQTLDMLMRASAAQHADRMAVFVDGYGVSYREMVACAAGVAHALCDSAAVGAARRCAVLGSRSFTAYAGVIGALLARNTYVPLNPRFPRDRLAAALAAADVDAMVVDERSAHCACPLLERMPRRILVLLPDAKSVPDWAVQLRQHRFLCQRDLAPRSPAGLAPGSSDDGAYLLFTSGSTGAPKGVLVRHRNVMAYLRNVAERYAPRSSDRFTQLFDLTFDLSVHDMFMCWGAGAALYCPPDSIRMAPRSFVRRHDITFWFSVPSTAALMARLHMLCGGDLPSLRWSLFCGEAMPKRLAETWHAAAPNSAAENLYGPTETTVAITAYRVPRRPADLARVPDVLPIGAPLSGQMALVGGADGRPVDDGADGELYLGGSQVTEGYWRQPDQTRERFVCRVGAPEASCWYRTGDRARMTAEHGLLFLGRMDRQVKVAGHRVELQEVEVVLRGAANSDVTAAIAWPLGADGLARGITAFVPAEAPASDIILDACRRILPPYMVPCHVCRVSDWPTNANGKTDYDALQRLMG